LSLALSISAQTSSSNIAPVQVPPLIQFSSIAADLSGRTPWYGISGFNLIGVLRLRCRSLCERTTPLRMTAQPSRTSIDALIPLMAKMSPTSPVCIAPYTQRLFFLWIGADAQDVPVEIFDLHF
jgi:hypothetical protein